MRYDTWSDVEENKDLNVYDREESGRGEGGGVYVSEERGGGEGPDSGALSESVIHT